MSDTFAPLAGALNTQAPVDALTAYANSIASGPLSLARQLITGRRAAYNMVWHNPRFTPAQIAAALGTRAAGVFTADAGLVAYLTPLLAAAGYTTDQIAAALPGVPAQWTTAWNPDGSVTITAKA